MTKLGQDGGFNKGWGRKRNPKKPKGVNQKQVDKVMKAKRVEIAVRAKAEEIQAYWKEISPVFDPGKPEVEHRKKPARGKAGAYRDSIKIFDTSDEHGYSARVSPTDWKARMIEYGHAHMPEYAPMAKVKARFRKGVK